uniref:uncharacterized protein LOC120336275 n=1 Tax=Styela clava TaxID=7725 RepID=UPI001939907A|nr:uncharacterized protein LOC120336275 [Styela clava]
MKAHQVSGVIILVFLANCQRCFSRRIYDAEAQFLSSEHLDESADFPSYREIKRQSADCPSIIDSPRHCPYVRGYSGTNDQENLSGSSITPWTTKIDMDPLRSPQAFPVVCCACTHCVDMSGSEPKILREHYSEKVYVKKEVRRAEDGFRPRYIKVAVGCTCVHKPFGGHRM